MSRHVLTDDPHPMVRYADRRGWGYAEAAEFFKMSESVFRVRVTGWRGTRWRTAQEWSLRAGGEFSAADVMAWHQRNRRSTGVAAGSSL